MGQFKPMVKMMTTEPTVELKLKKGGHVNMKSGGKAEEGHKKMAMGGMTKMGSVKTAAPSKDGIAVKGKTKGKMVTMKSGGRTC
jgi:hypothetical protein